MGVVGGGAEQSRARAASQSVQALRAVCRLCGGAFPTVRGKGRVTLYSRAVVFCDLASRIWKLLTLVGT